MGYNICIPPYGESTNLHNVLLACGEQTDNVKLKRKHEFQPLNKNCQEKQPFSMPYCLQMKVGGLSETKSVLWYCTNENSLPRVRSLGEMSCPVVKGKKKKKVIQIDSKAFLPQQIISKTVHCAEPLSSQSEHFGLMSFPKFHHLRHWQRP